MLGKHCWKQIMKDYQLHCITIFHQNNTFAVLASVTNEKLKKLIQKKNEEEEKEEEKERERKTEETYKINFDLLQPN